MTKPLLSWKRPTKTETEVSIWKVWVSKCGRYRIVHSVSKYGLPEAFVAEKFLPTQQITDHMTPITRTIATTRKHNTAIAACEKAERLRLREEKHGATE